MIVGQRLPGGAKLDSEVVNPGLLIAGSPRTGAHPHHFIKGAFVPDRYARIDVFGPQLNVYRDLCHWRAEACSSEQPPTHKMLSLHVTNRLKRTYSSVSPI